MSESGLVEYLHPSAGFGLGLPSGWERVENPAPGVALVAVEPEHELGFRANAVVTLDELPEGVNLSMWQSEAEQMLADTLHDYLLLDLEALDAGEAHSAAVRRLAHHLVGDAEAVTMHQWACLRDRTGFTLTTSASTLVYDSLADTFGEVAETFRAALHRGSAR